MEVVDTPYGAPPPLADKIVEQWYNQLQFRDTIQDLSVAYEGDEKEEDRPVKALPKSKTRSGGLLQDLRLRAGGWLAQSASVASLKVEVKPTQTMSALTIGGISVQNTALVIGTGQERFADLPVTTLGGHQAHLGPAAVVMSKAVADQEVQTPALVFSDTLVNTAQNDSWSMPELPGVPIVPPVYGDQVSLTVPATSYVLKGDIQALFGITLFAAQIYYYHDGTRDGPAREHVIPIGNRLARWRRFTTVTQFDAILPLKPMGLSFIYDESPTELHFDPGLRLEADFDFTGRLQPVADVLHMIFGGDSKQKVPTSIRLSAHLSDKGDKDRWAKWPQPSVMSLTGSVKMSLWLTEYLEFTELGVFVKTNKKVRKGGTHRTPESKKREAEAPASDHKRSDKRRRLDDMLRDYAGNEILEDRAAADAADTGDVQAELDKEGVSFGLFGEVNIHYLPGTGLPLHAIYKITRRWIDENSEQRLMEKRMLRSIIPGYWQTEFLAEVDDWPEAFGFKNLTIHGIKLDMHWKDEAGEKWESAILLEARMKLGTLDLEVTGQYLGGDTCIEAYIEELKWSDIVAMYKLLIGADAQPKTDGHQLSFKDLNFMISNKGFSIECKIEFNGFAAAAASIAFSGEGLHIKSALEWEGSGVNGQDIFKPFTIPDTQITLNNAHLDIFIGRKSSPGANTIGHKSSMKISVRRLDGSVVPSPKEGHHTSRPSRFAIRGEVDFAGVKIAAGLVYSYGKDKRRQWVLFGAYLGVIRTSYVAPILEGTWLDAELSDLAIVASSHDLKGSSHAEIPLDYPISKGLNLCAALAPIDQINRFSGSTGTEVRGVAFVACISPKGLKLTLHMPPTFVATISDAAQIRDFQIAVNLSKKAALDVGGNLYLTLQNQEDPLIFEINLTADLFGLKGSVLCNSVWKNPFGISDKVEITKMAGEIGFFYACAPHQFGIAAAGQAGPVKAGVAFAVGALPDEQVIAFNISDLHIGPILEFIGDVNDIQALRDCGRADFLVFVEAQLYFSTGGSIAKEEYPAGISASGKVIVFGKTAMFKAVADENGFEFRGSIDEFEIGPLKVGAANGERQAKLEIIATRNEQRLLVNGMISFYDLYFKVLIEASLQPFNLNVSIAIHLGDILKFDLEASIKNVKRGSVQGREIHFFAEFQADILGKFCDAAIQFLNDLRKAADRNIDAMKVKLVDMKADVEARRAAAEKEVERREAALATARVTRDRECAQQEVKAAEARHRIIYLKKVVQDAKDQEAEAVKEAERELQIMQQRFDAKKRAARQEYNRELRHAENEHTRLSRELAEAENRKRVNFDYAERDLEAAQKEVARLQNDYNWHDQRVRDLRRWRDEAWWPWEKVHKTFEIEGTVIARDAIGTSMRIANWTLERCKEAVWTTKRAGLEKIINDTAGLVIFFGDSVNRLLTQGPEAFVEGLVKNEWAELARQKQYLRDLLDNNTQYAQAIRDAIVELEKATPELEHIIIQCNKAVANARDNKGLKELEAARDKVKSEERLLEEQSKNLTRTLEDIRTGVHITTDVLTGMAAAVKFVVPRITRVMVQVDASDLRNGNKFRFEVEATAYGRTSMLSIAWDPRSDPHNLFTDIAKEAAGI